MGNLIKIIFSIRSTPRLCITLWQITQKNISMGTQCHLVNGTGRREEHKMLRYHAFAR